MKQCPTCGVRFYERSTHCPIDGAPLADLPDPLIGRVIQERYVIEQLIGSGGMGSVYRGRHQLIQRQVALKFLGNQHARDDDSRQRFLREARSVNRVQHDHIVDVSDFGETEDGLVYLVMEYLSGRTLGADIASGPLALERACQIGLQLAMALGHAHELGVVHRDIKPSNIFLIRKGADLDFVKLLDFGLARAVDDIALTRSNLMFGTPEYMAPEQATKNPVDMKADLYAFGCVLFEMVSGRLPFEGAPTGLIFKHVYETPPRLRQLQADTPKALDHLVTRLLSKAPERRPASAYEVADELSRIAASLPASSPGPSTPGSSRVSGPVLSGVQSTEEDLWHSNLVALQARIAERYQHADAPEPVRVAMRRVAELVSDAQGLRKNLGELNVSTVQHHDTVRSAQLRIGAAIDALALDESRVDQELEALNLAFHQADALLQARSSALLVAVAAVETALATTARLLDPARAWASAQQAVQALRDRVTEREVARADLRFQISHLKGRLASLEADSNMQLEPTLARAGDVQQRLSAKLAAIRDEAERITETLAEAPTG